MKKPKRGRQGEGGGRPKKVIDYATVEKLAMIQCTQEEISAWLGISTVTLGKDAKFLEVYKGCIDKGRMSLRRHQWRALEAGNTTMLVWLGKQYLGQRDKSENHLEANINLLERLSDVEQRTLAAALELIARNKGEDAEGTAPTHH